MGLIRSLAAVVVGAVVGIAVMLLVQYVNGVLLPLPQGTDPSDPASMAAAVARMPAAALVGLVAGYFVGTTIGAAASARVAPAYPLAHAVLVAAVFVVVGVANFLAVSHPPWVVIASFAAFCVAPFLGARIGSPPVIHRRRSA